MPGTGINKVNMNVKLDSLADDEVSRPARDRIDVLSLADEQDNGVDPYNSTGQYCKLPEQEQE